MRKVTTQEQIEALDSMIEILINVMNRAKDNRDVGLEVKADEWIGKAQTERHRLKEKLKAKEEAA